MKEINFKVRSNNEIAPDIFEMDLLCEEGNVEFLPGQFINIKIEGLFLRRPISICWWDDKSIGIIYKVVGRGTEIMSSYKEDQILSVLTPLGNGFDTSRAGKNPVLIGGGVGVPPIYGLCKTLIEEDVKPQVVLGFNSASDAFYLNEFEKLGITPIVTTIDGTEGIKGLVTDALEVLECSYFYACGPEKMLQAIDRVMDAEVEGELSFEERMGCGFGACMGCSCKTKYGYKRICKEGPVLNRNEVIW